MELKYLYFIQKKTIEVCCTGMQPRKYNAQLLHKLNFRYIIKGDIKWNNK
jgi:hypothetical protein